MGTDQLTKEERGWFIREGKPLREFYIWRGEAGYIQGWQQWSEWFRGRWNWQNFTLIEVTYEDEGYTGHREISLGLLGFRTRILWCYDREAEGMKIVKERQMEVKAHPDLAVDLAEIFGDDDE